MPDWLAIKNRFVASNLNNVQLANEFGVSEAAIRKHRKAEHWDDERCDFARMCSKKTMEKISDAESDIAAIKARMRVKWWQQQERMIDAVLSSPIEDDIDSAVRRRELQNYCDLLDHEPQDGREALEKLDEIISGIDALAKDDDPCS